MNLFVALRCLIISTDVKYARRLKSGLDDTRRAQAMVFTSPENAREHLKIAAQDVVILDVDNLKIPPNEILDMLLEEQQELGFILLSGEEDGVVGLAATIRIVKRDVRVRDLLPLIEDIRRAISDNLPDTAQMLPVDQDDTRLIDNPPPPPPSPSDETFKKLAAEEPPFPDDATISDLQSVLVTQDDTPSSSLANMPKLAQPTQDASRIPATLILESALGDTTPLDQLALETFVRNLEDKLAGLVRPLPSWENDAERFVREPSFLPPTLPEVDQSLEYTSATTLASSPDDVADFGEDFVTELQEPRHASRPPQSTDDLAEENTIDDVAEEDIVEEDIVEEDIVEDVVENVEYDAPVDELIQVFDQDDEPLIMSQPILPIIDEELSSDDSQLVQIASVITQMALETAASATVLLWRNQMIAAAGEMPREDIDALFEQESRLMEPIDSPQKMFFVTLNTSGANYMLMLMPTVDELLLVLIFSGNQPLRTIRRQTSRLVDALASVPSSQDIPAETLTDVPPDERPDTADKTQEPAPVISLETQIDTLEDADTSVGEASNTSQVIDVDTSEKPATPPEVAPQPVQIPERDWGVRRSYTFVWVLSDPDHIFRDDVARALVRGIDMQFTQQGWLINEIDVHEDYIQMQADVPGEKPPYHYVHDLMRFSADIVRAQIDDGRDIWADSYLVKSPAHRLDAEEVQQFLNFVWG
jgi:REP element-mobilizing transposase RayT